MEPLSRDSRNSLSSSIAVATRSPGEQFVHLLHRLGCPISDRSRIAYEIICLTIDTFSRAFRAPWRAAEICAQIVQIGVGSLPIILIATAFAGLVITQEIAWHMDRALHTVTMVPGFTAQFILRELGIAIPAMLLASKVGASTAAEVGTMKVTEQIDALKLLGIDPIDYLVFPRLIASLISTVCLTLMSIGVTLFCALSVAVVKFNFTWLEYINAVRHFVTPMDFVAAITKALCFGAAIPIVACAYGFRCEGGAEGVGTATTNAVVTTTIVIITLDFLLTFFFSQLF